MARFFESITLTNFLSFGPESTTLELEDVNVLVGVNGVGKSNLIEAINVLRHAPRDIAQPLREGGGVREFLWRPRGEATQEISFTLEITVAAGRAGKEKALDYTVDFDTSEGLTLQEWLGDEGDAYVDNPECYFRAGKGHVFVGGKAASLSNGRHILKEGDETAVNLAQSIDSSVSVLAQRKDPVFFKEATQLSENLDKVRVYRHWVTGPLCPLRFPRRPDSPTNSLLENLENFPSRIATLKGTPSVKRRLLELLKDVSPGFDDIEVVPEGGALQLYLIEGDRKIASYRLSDGTLRYLMLLTILLDPTPPPLIVIEEPEISLHPDVLPTLRNLILEAGERTQIIITTQSPTFLDAWTDHPSAVVVCEREGDSTTFIRLDPKNIREEDDGLGVRWTRGEIGGNRW